MSILQMTPDSAWVAGSVIVAVVSAGPAYLMARRSRAAESTPHAEAAHAATRETIVDAINAAIGPLHGRLDEMHATLADQTAWQREHAVQHAVNSLHRSPILEMRKAK